MNMRRRPGRDFGSNPAKDCGVSVAVCRAAQSAALTFTLCFGVTSAFAADLPAPIPSPANAPAVYNWTGLHIGGNIGAGWSGLSDTNTNFSDTFGSTFSAATNAQFLGGGQVGVNYEFAKRPARLCLGPCAALRQGRRRLGRDE